MTALIERLRWHVAPLLDRLPNFCWADLVMWANGNGEPLPRWSIRSCQEDADRKGSCWCGKVRDEQAEARWYAEHHDTGGTLDDEPAQWPEAQS